MNQPVFKTNSETDQAAGFKIEADFERFSQKNDVMDQSDGAKAGRDPTAKIDAVARC